MAKSFYEAIIAHGGFAGQAYDIAAGGTETQTGDVIDVLLGDSGGTNASLLQENAPINLISTGALGGARELDITNIEDSGRMFFLSVRNSDISGVNTLTITATTDINGGGASLVLSSATEILFVHEGAEGATAGNWRAYEQTLQGATSNIARIFRDTFAAVDWDAGASNNQIEIPQTGAAGAGQIGPHGLMVATSYVVQVYRDSDDEQVDVGLEVTAGGLITMTKAGLGPDFAGRVVVVGD
ncbi:MAG: hypothetical protein ACXABY_04640 [Candidatus Thorarchaeota archaeon]|jgi:hypothetical protein